MSERAYSIAKGYRYGFNGKENDNEVKGNGNQQDYGFRIYDPRLGKFLSVDPLTKDYPWYTPYQFAGNMPIVAVDLDGAEPEVVTGGVNTLVITIQGYEMHDPPKGKTQVKNNPRAKTDAGDLNTLSDLEKEIPALRVVHFSSADDDDLTEKDVEETIATFQKNNPHGQVILIGHSLGGDNVVEIVNSDPSIKANVVTIDISDGIQWDDDDIPSNVPWAINFYDPNSSGSPGGELVEPASGNSTSKILNIPVFNTDHKNIDNKLSGGITNMIRNTANENNKREGVPEICPAYE